MQLACSHRTHLFVSGAAQWLVSWLPQHGHSTSLLLYPRLSSPLPASVQVAAHFAAQSALPLYPLLIRLPLCVPVQVAAAAAAADQSAADTAHSVAAAGGFAVRVVAAAAPAVTVTAPAAALHFSAAVHLPPSCLDLRAVCFKARFSQARTLSRGGIQAAI